MSGSVGDGFLLQSHLFDCHLHVEMLHDEVAHACQTNFSKTFFDPSEQLFLTDTVHHFKESVCIKELVRQGSELPLDISHLEDGHLDFIELVSQDMLIIVVY